MHCFKSAIQSCQENLSLIVFPIDPARADVLWLLLPRMHTEDVLGRQPPQDEVCARHLRIVHINSRIDIKMVWTEIDVSAQTLLRMLVQEIFL